MIICKIIMHYWVDLPSKGALILSLELETLSALNFCKLNDFFWEVEKSLLLLSKQKRLLHDDILLLIFEFSELSDINLSACLSIINCMVVKQKSSTFLLPDSVSLGVSITATWWSPPASLSSLMVSLLTVLTLTWTWVQVAGTAAAGLLSSTVNTWEYEGGSGKLSSSWY